MKLFIKITIIVFAILIGFGTFSYIKENNLRNQNKQTVTQANDELIKASVNFVKAYLNVYYVTNKTYPMEIGDLQEIKQISDTEVRYEKLREAIGHIKDFSYTVRGDRQAYKIIYSDENGNKIEIEGNYNQEFH